MRRFSGRRKESRSTGKKGHSEEEILRILREAESGDTVVEICRKHGISQQTFYLWKKKYAGLGLNELRELRQLREDNAKLKRLVADLILDRHILQEIVTKQKAVRPCARSELAEWMQQVDRLSQRRVAGLIPVERMSCAGCISATRRRSCACVYENWPAVVCATATGV